MIPKDESGDLFKRGNNSFSILVCSASESDTNKPIYCCLSYSDVDRTMSALNEDRNFMNIVEDKTPNEIKILVETVLCHFQRQNVRRYGFQH